MSRVTTYGNNQSALLNLMTAQKRTSEAQNRFSTGKNATDLVGFGREAATVNALKSTQMRVMSHIDTNKAVADRLSAQDLAMVETAKLGLAFIEQPGSQGRTKAVGAAAAMIEDEGIGIVAIGAHQQLLE